MGRATLQNQLPHIIVIARFKNITVEETYREGEGNREWVLI